MNKFWVSNISGIGFAITGIIMPIYVEFIKPYAGYILVFGLFLIIVPWVLVLIDFFRNKKSLPRKSPERCNKEYILRLMAIEDYIRQLKNSPLKFKPRRIRNLSDLIANEHIKAQNREDADIYRTEVLSKYKNLKTDIEQEYPDVFKGLSKNPTYEIVVHEINCLLNTFKRMQRSEE